MSVRQSEPPSAILHYHTFAGFIRERCDLPEAEIAWLERCGRRRAVRRGAAFCGIGQAHHEFAFVEDGILQVYTVRTDGLPVVLDFVFPGQLALALEGALRGTPSNVCFEAVTPCTLIVWPYEIQAVVAGRSPSWDRLATRLAQEAYLRKHQRYMSLRVQSAEERYATLMQDSSIDWQIIPKHVLASFLCITPQYLSQLKRKSSSRSKFASL